MEKFYDKYNKQFQQGDIVYNPDYKNWWIVSLDDKTNELYLYLYGSSDLEIVPLQNAVDFVIEYRLGDIDYDGQLLYVLSTGQELLEGSEC